MIDLSVYAEYMQNCASQKSRWQICCDLDLFRSVEITGKIADMPWAPWGALVKACFFVWS